MGLPRSLFLESQPNPFKGNVVETLKYNSEHWVLSSWLFPLKKKKNDWESQSESKRKGSRSGGGAVRGRRCRECFPLSTAEAS